MSGRIRSKSLPSFKSLDELVGLFDTNDLGGYDMPEAQFGVEIKRRAYLVAVDAELAQQLAKIARAQRTPFERLINSWLREKIREQVQTTQ